MSRFEMEGLVTGLGIRIGRGPMRWSEDIGSSNKFVEEWSYEALIDPVQASLFRITGENVHHGTPVNPQMPSNNPGGSSSGSAVAVAAKIVDFALGTVSIGCVRIPAAYCGVLGYRRSHGAASLTGVLPNSHSLDTVDQGPELMKLGQYIVPNVPSLKGFCVMPTSLIE
ncbi:hypothetical protein Droror1_Dr00007289 [Drosera rotundifolia]